MDKTGRQSKDQRDQEAQILSVALGQSLGLFKPSRKIVCWIQWPQVFPVLKFYDSRFENFLMATSGILGDMVI